MKTTINLTLGAFLLITVWFLAGCENNSEVEKYEIVKLKVDVKILVGQILYEDVETVITVKGLSEAHKTEWIKDFNYTSEDNLLLVKKGYPHYTISVQKWGTTDEQTLTADQLWNDRADGPTPIAYVLGGAAPAKKLLYYTSHLKKESSQNILPQNKVAYAYNELGKLEKMTFYKYSSELNDFEEDRYFMFTYEGNRVISIAGYQVEDNEFYIEDLYEYTPSGNILRIRENNYGSGINSEVNFSYNFSEGTIEAAYTFSNETSFEYYFNHRKKNIVSDKITRYGALCSEGEYGYDKNINPLRHLGYVDFLLRNFSVNNKLDEHINYIACAFAELIPERFEYVYNTAGYPTIATTHFTNGVISQTEYFYE